jgi:[ribosomal protein S18]-alanine N-acetyltransferase
MAEGEQEAKSGNFSGECSTGARVFRGGCEPDRSGYTDVIVDLKYQRMSQRFSIREFQRNDFPRLWEIDQKCFPTGISYSQPELLFYMRRPRAFTLVAESGTQDGNAGLAVGFLVAEAGKQAGHIITLDVLDEFRRSGLGSRLMQAAEERLRAEGCRTVFLETAVDNAAALAFYKQHHYFLVKTLPRYYATGVDAFVLKKDLLSNK